MPNHQFFWLDLETTGLDPNAPGAMILEWAYVLAADDADGDMSVVDSCTSPIKCDVDPAKLDPWPRKTHTASGLLAEIRLGADDLPTIAESDEMLLGVLQEISGEQAPKGIVLAGSTVSFDLAWARVHLPRFAACLSHHVYDVSVLKRHAEVLGIPPMPNVAGAEYGSHRAMPDILHSLAYAKYFREQLVRRSDDLPSVERGVRYALCSPTPAESKRAGGYSAWKAQQALREDRYICEAVGT